MRGTGRTGGQPNEVTAGGVSGATRGRGGACVWHSPPRAQRIVAAQSAGGFAVTHACIPRIAPRAWYRGHWLWGITLVRPLKAMTR
jgi:hypothetical protein